MDDLESAWTNIKNLLLRAAEEVQIGIAKCGTREKELDGGQMK